MKFAETRLVQMLDRLHGHYGVQDAAGPADPDEMIVFVNCGYPATDASCAKGYEALKADVGTEPEKIEAASKAKLARLMRLGGIVPELRAERLKSIAQLVKREFGGDLRRALDLLLHGAADSPQAGISKVKKALKKFPVIGEPGADKILLFARMAPVAAVPSVFVCVPQRLWLGQENKNYSAGYQAAQALMEEALPAAFEARQRAYLLLKRHGQEICRRTEPRCGLCPVSGFCAYFQENQKK